MNWADVVRIQRKLGPPEEVSDWVAVVELIISVVLKVSTSIRKLLFQRLGFSDLAKGLLIQLLRTTTEGLYNSSLFSSPKSRKALEEIAGLIYEIVD
jgi:hypothetical protein